MELITDIGKRITRVKFVGKSDKDLTNGKIYDVIYIDFEDQGIMVIDDNSKITYWDFDEFMVIVF